MRFRHKKSGLKRSKTRRLISALLLVAALGGLAGGLYLLLLVSTPYIPQLYPVQPIKAESLPQPQGDMIYIPKIGVSVPLAAGSESALDIGAWHRFPDRGDPVIGGNFIVSAHRFEIGFTPGQTRQKSPFYHIDKLAVGDQIVVDYKGKRYGYEITAHNAVKPTQTEIEAPSDEPKLTLYTCTLGGESDGREVFIAKPLGEVVNGKVSKQSV